MTIPLSNPAISHQDLSLRPIDDTDHPFLVQLYGTTRASELAQMDLSDEQKQWFINMQFDAQHKHYQEHYPDASFDIILHKNSNVGRLYLEEWPSQFRIIDIALLPKHCNQGIGSWFLNNIMQRASKKNKSVTIHVEKNNPAMRLYKRLGFKKIDEQSVYDLMEWKASSSHTTKT